MNPYVLTHSGQRVDLLRPDPATIRLDDIAVALSRQPRFNGHTLRISWSVAEHSMLVANAAGGRWTLAGLLHDAAEAYIGDVVHPLKSIPAVREALGPIEAGLNRAIERSFGLSPGELDHDKVKTADLRALATEARDLMPDDPSPWPALRGVEPIPGGLDVGTERVASEFITRVRECM